MIGTSAGTNDLHLIPLLKYLYENGDIKYIELYIRPDATLEQLVKWRDLGIDLNYHAPHDDRADFRKDYLDLAIEARKVIGKMGFIIFNAGVNPDIDVFNIKGDALIPEVMPAFTKFGDRGNFTLPTQVKGKFCLDFSHAYATAKVIGEKPEKLIDAFIEKEPVHFHLADIASEYIDDYAPLGKGKLPLRHIIKRLPKSCEVTVETEHELETREEDIVRDVQMLRKCLKWKR
jgi:hypothetical protein